MFEKNKINYDEIKKLKDLLAMNNIDYAFIPHELGEGYHLYYPSMNNVRCSVILNPYSYGHEYGQLEIMGLLTEEEEQIDSVVGYLSAYEVFQRIVKDYKENGI